MGHIKINHLNVEQITVKVNETFSLQNSSNTTAAHDHHAQNNCHASGLDITESNLSKDAFNSCFEKYKDK
ncbi:MAG: hypothetical protein GKR92_08355 [Gammaproteobacteria bacterium]|nr:MAG: hypothetical protein GKR92_08355 [Gammaproteobacteria bacterium]